MITIDVLPDDALLAIFDYCVVIFRYSDERNTGSFFDMKRVTESWQLLVHVCRRWRGLVFGSPRRLNLQLYSIPRTSARNSLDVWPPLPLLIWCNYRETETDNAIAELDHSDRIRQISLHRLTTSHIEKLCMAMQVPFPELECLSLTFESSCGPVLPDSFLDGSAPCLRSLEFIGIPFPGLPKILLSATHLHTLWLTNIPHLGYISPEVMVTCLSVLISLQDLQLGFQSPQSCPDQDIRYPHPLTRSVLPALRHFSFKGVNEYLEDLVSLIDAPRLHDLLISLFNDIHFDTPELNKFLSRTSTLGDNNVTHITFYSHEALVWFESGRLPHYRMIKVSILCQVPDWQLSSLAQICSLSFHLPLTTEKLYIHERLDSPSDWNGVIENTEWLDLLLPFTAVKNLYLSKKIATHIARALHELTGTTEVLPALQNIFLEGFRPSEPVQEDIARFISARRLTNPAIAVSNVSGKV